MDTLNHHFTPLPKDVSELTDDLLAPVETTQQAFKHLDDAQLGWFHLRAVIVAGVGFLTDAYDLFVISLVIPMIYQGMLFLKGIIEKMYLSMI